MKNTLLACFLATALSALTTRATVSNITPTGDQLLDKSEYSRLSGENNNSLAGNLNLLNSLIDPDQASVGAKYDVNNLTSFTSLPGWHYAVLHFGGQGGGYWQVWDLQGYGGEIFTSLPFTSSGQRVGALSSVSYIPDGGSTLMLLGAALSVIAVARRKFGI